MTLVVDSHAHAFRDLGSMSAFIKTMQEAGIDRTVLCAIEPGPRGHDASNDYVKELVHEYPGRFIGFASVNPLLPNPAKEVERWLGVEGFKGIKLHPAIQGYSIADHRVFPVVAKAAQLNAPILIHTGPVLTPGTRLRDTDVLDVEDLAMALPEAKLIIAHGDPFSPGVWLAAKYNNVYMDTANTLPRWESAIPGIGTKVVEWLSHGGQHGASKLLLGSDAITNKTQRLIEHVEFAKHLDVSEEDRSLIMGGNAVRLLGLTQ